VWQIRAQQAEEQLKALTVGPPVEDSIPKPAQKTPPASPGSPVLDVVAPSGPMGMGEQLARLGIVPAVMIVLMVILAVVIIALVL
jgi:hypothetical protein